MLLGRGLIKAQPQPDGGKLDEGEVVRRELVVACRHPPTLLDLVEEPLDQIARTIEVGAEADRLRPVPSRRNVRPCAVLAYKCPDPISVKPPISEQHCPRFQR